MSIRRHAVGIAIATLAALAAAPARAQPSAATAASEATQGKTMVDKDCNACHARTFGDAAAAYTRIDRRVNTPAQLKAQVAYCNSQLGTGYFPEEEDHIAAYLELQYYRFKR